MEKNRDLKKIQHRRFLLSYISPRNLYLALKGQLPIRRAWRNFFITGNAWGMFHQNSHWRANQGGRRIKQAYNTPLTAKKSAEAMSEKQGVHFSYYKCLYCNGYHLGKNRDSAKQ